MSPPSAAVLQELKVWGLGGGLTDEGRSRREQVRLQAAKMFAQDTDARQIARSLRVSTKSVCQWRRAWRAGGEAGLIRAFVPNGPVPSPRLGR